MEDFNDIQLIELIEGVEVIMKEDDIAGYIKYLARRGLTYDDISTITGEEKLIESNFSREVIDKYNVFLVLETKKAIAEKIISGDSAMIKWYMEKVVGLDLLVSDYQEDKGNGKGEINQSSVSYFDFSELEDVK